MSTPDNLKTCPKTCTVVFEEADVAALSTVAPDRVLLPLTPMARFRAEADGHDVLDGAATFNDSSHRRAVRDLAQIRMRTDDALADLPGPEREILRAQFDRMIFTQLRIAETLNVFETCTIRVANEWVSLPRDEAIAALTEELIRRRSPNWLATIQRLGMPPLAGLYRCLMRVLARAVRVRCRSGRVATGSLKDVGGIMDAVMAEGSSVIVFEGARGGWRDYASLLRQGLKLPFGRGPFVLRVTGGDPELAEVRHKQIAERSGSPAMQTAAQNADETFKRALAGLDAARRDMVRLFDIFQPTAYLSSEISRATDLLCAEAAGDRGIVRVVLGRNAQGPTQDADALDFKRLYLTARYPVGLVDIALFWSRTGLQAGQQYLPASLNKGLVSDAIAVPPPKRPKAVRRILVADSFTSWWTRHWWGIQTSDEYVNGLHRLAETVSGMENVELVIRAKDKRECRVSALAADLARYPSVTLEGRERAFAASLAEADLLVSFFSTTIQESLSAGVPVLLFGGTNRHHYLPARGTPPTTDDRAAIYGIDGSVDLKTMLSAILDAHAAAPLSQEERRDYLSDTRAPGAIDVGRALAQGRSPTVFNPFAETAPADGDAAQQRMRQAS